MRVISVRRFLSTFFSFKILFRSFVSITRSLFSSIPMSSNVWLGDCKYKTSLHGYILTTSNAHHCFCCYCCCCCNNCRSCCTTASWSSFLCRDDLTWSSLVFVCYHHKSNYKSETFEVELVCRSCDFFYSDSSRQSYLIILLIVFPPKNLKFHELNFFKTPCFCLYNAITLMCPFLRGEGLVLYSLHFG